MRNQAVFVFVSIDEFLRYRIANGAPLEFIFLPETGRPSANFRFAAL
jgi:hypothetical protein